MMIRKLQNADMDRVAGIWLDTNLRAHCFISPQYWKSNFDPEKKCCPGQKSMFTKMTGKYGAL